MSPPRVLVPDRAIRVGGIVHPDRNTIHHLTNVLRLTRGDKVVLVDGDGSAFLARLSLEEGGFSLVVEDEARDDRSVSQSSSLVLVLALLKSDRTELAVQKCAEAGVSSVLVAVCDRSVPRPDPSGMESRLGRLRRVAGEAARQCGRASAPEVTLYPSLDEALASLDTGMQRFLLHEDRSAAPLTGQLARDEWNGAVLAVGPEGSFTDRELSLMEDEHFVRAGLGPRILRAETAAIAGVIVAQSMIGDMAPG